MDLWNDFWSVFVWFFWIYVLMAYFFALFSVIGDIFRDHTLNGWGKALWLIFLIFLPILALLVYVIARGRGMSERSMRSAADARKETDAYIRSVASTSSADEIAKAQSLLESGAISPEEFAALKARAGHARTLAGSLTAASVIDSGFPTTTAAALATLTTGTAPGQHGLVGYSVLDTENDRVVNQLSGWDARLDPRTWQSQPTLFERATEAGYSAVVVGPARYKDSGFSGAVLRGAEYLAGATIADRFARAAEWLRAPGPNGIAYVYVPELDQTGHASGWESPAWTNWLEILDAEIRAFTGGLSKKFGVLVTADHGVVDIPQHAHVLIDEIPGLLDGIRFVAGEPRCLQLHFEPTATEEERAAIVQAWCDSEESRAWIATRDEAIAAANRAIKRSRGAIDLHHTRFSKHSEVLSDAHLDCNKKQTINKLLYQN